MPNQAYDTQTIPFIAKITGDKPLKVKQVNFIVTLTKPDGTELEKIEVREDVDSSKFPRAATHNLKKPVPDDLDYYEVKANAWWKSPSDGGGKVEAGETAAVRVWPDEIEIKFTADDAKACEKVEFKLVPESGKPTERTSNDNGLWKARGPQSKFDIEITPPWEILSTIRGTGRLREYEIDKKSYTATITAPKYDAKKTKIDTPDPDNTATKLSVYKQYVNLPATKSWDPACPAGHIVKVEVGVSDQNIAQEGDIIFIQCDFKKQPETVRTSPKVQLSGDNLVEGSLKPINSGKSNTGQVKLEAGKTAWFNVKLGIGGGDICVVKVGTTDPPGDAELILQNWRKVDYEILQPNTTKPDQLTDNTFVKSTGLPTDVKTAMKDSFDKVFVEFACLDTQVFDKSVIGDPAFNSCVIDKAWMEPRKGGTGRVFVGAVVLDNPNDVYDLKGDPLDILDKMAKFKKNPQTFNMVFMDYLVVMKKLNETKNIHDISKTIFFQNDVMERTFKDFHGFKRGDYPIKKVLWKATKWIEKKAKLPKDLSLWNDITDPKHPGWAYRNTVTITGETNIKKIFKMKNSWDTNLISVKNPQNPGIMDDGTGLLVVEQVDSITRLMTKYVINIALTVQGICYGGAGGCALKGKIMMTTAGGNYDDDGLADVLLHEMGHNIGMTYLAPDKIDKAEDKKWGRKPEFDIPGYPPPDGVDATPPGKYYANRGHTGCHCTDGLLSNDGLTAGDPKNANYSEAEYTGKCIMYGSGDMSKGPKLEFCDDCQKHLMNEDLSDVKKVWIKQTTT